MLKVGDMVQELPSDADVDDIGPIWFVTAVEPRDDGKVEVVLERYDDDRRMITSTMTVNGSA